MALRQELAGVVVLRLTQLELLLDKKDEKLLSVDLGDLHVAVRISVKEKLLRDALRQEVEEGLRGHREVAYHIVADITLKWARKQIVDLVDEDSHLWNELNEALWHKDDTVVLAKLGSLADDVGDILRDLGKRLVLGLDLLTNKHAVDTSSQSALKSDMGGRSTHESDEVIVLFRGDDI